VRKLIQHVIVFAAVNAFLIAVWVLIAGGSPEKLQDVMNKPGDAVDIGFWPIFPLLGWGVLLVIHAGFAVSNTLFGDRAARRRRKMVNQAASGAKDIAKEVVAAIDKAHERRNKRQVRRDEREADVRPATPSRRWVTVMFCDIAGSTSHNERLGDEEWHRVLAHIRTVVRSALAQRGGNEVGTQGDGMLARFESPADAVLCGIDIQDELGQARGSSDFVPEVRIGVHAGDAVEEDGDLIGRVINLASRVTDEANPGEILVTEPVADQLVGKLELEDKGLRPLKGIAQPRHLLAVRWTDDTSDG
jgi:class 3 adenylate cyclase